GLEFLPIAVEKAMTEILPSLIGNLLADGANSDAPGQLASDIQSAKIAALTDAREMYREAMKANSLPALLGALGAPPEPAARFAGVYSRTLVQGTNSPEWRSFLLVMFWRLQAILPDCNEYSLRS